ncbi:unnamed protein product [Onchocerca ochengi]|uniref:SAM domain-containing protein n=1 Tax=Onchocerca ochengi TaxID=42157 RepID=A0A182DXB1_ONCOC|nr:unnamed protein product [Onchocerca ochengi]
MPSRLGPRSGSAVVQQIPRQVSVPIVPDINTQKYRTCQTNIVKPVAAEDFYHLERPVVLQQRNGLLESRKYCKNAKSLSNMLHVPSTSMTALMVPSSLYFVDDSYSVHSLLNGKKDCSMHSDMNLEMECQRNVITASPSSSSDLKQRSFSVNGQNSDDLLCNSCHRNSAGSSSSHDSSSGFESMKLLDKRNKTDGSKARVNGIIFVHQCIGTPFLRDSSDVSCQDFVFKCTICGSSLGLLPHSSQSRLSVQSCSSGDASLIMNNTANLFDDSATEHVNGDNLMDISRLSFSDMMLKGVEESEILALWLGSLGYPEYLTAFLAQGYDLPTIARITPEDLTALGITHPNHRKLLISEIHRWRITDTWPTLVPSGKLRDWLPLIGLPEYVALFEDQGYCTVAEIQNFTWEDFEDIGIKKLGHLKRLGLAIKKMKDHKFGRNQPKNDLQQLVTVAVHHNKIGAQASFLLEIGTVYKKAIYDDLRSHLEMPPLSAATSTFYPANLDSLYNNYSTMRKQHSHLCEVSSTESHAQKQAVQVYPHYQSLANEVVPYHLQGCDQQSLKCGLNKQKTSSLQMNLYSLSQILSDESLQKHSVIQQQSVFPARILSTADNSISSDSEDYPPPPAPLVCEGSVQLLKSAFNESAMATTTESDITNDSNFERHYDEISSFSSNEQLSFAKDNCDAVKSCNGLLLGHKCNEESTNSRFSQPNTACRRLHNSSYSTSARNGDILNDIGSMLQNLTDELDAMLLPSQSVQYSSRQIPF